MIGGMSHESHTNRDLQALETKNRIYEVGMDLIRRKGFEHVSISEICREAGVSVGLFYYYFSTKQEILNEKFRRADEYFDDRIRSSLPDGHAGDRIRRYAQGYFSFVRDDGLDLMRHFYSTGNTFFVQSGRAMQRVLRDVILEGQRRGQVRVDMNAEECVNTAFTVLRGVVFDWALRDGSYDVVSDTDRYVEMLVAYLCVPSRDGKKRNPPT